MALTTSEFGSLLADATKRIRGPISWQNDEDHSPTVEFRVEVDSDPGHPIFIVDSYNPCARALTYAMIHRGEGRIYGLDLGKEHRNPDGTFVGEKHKHSWREDAGVKYAYVPADITKTVDDPVGVWEQFCAEANIRHDGSLASPNSQKELF